MAEPPAKSQFLIYRSEDGRIKIDVRFEGETVWLTQALMAELFDSTKQNIGQHLKHIFEEGELEESSVVKYYLTTAADGKNYRTAFYNLDAISSTASSPSTTATSSPMSARSATNWRSLTPRGSMSRFGDSNSRRLQRRRMILKWQ